MTLTIIRVTQRAHGVVWGCKRVLYDDGRFILATVESMDRELLRTAGFVARDRVWECERRSL